MNKKAYISPELVIEDVELETVLQNTSDISVYTEDPDDEREWIENGYGEYDF